LFYNCLGAVLVWFESFWAISEQFQAFAGRFKAVFRTIRGYFTLFLGLFEAVACLFGDCYGVFWPFLGQVGLFQAIS
jgi:hypothetical protein